MNMDLEKIRQAFPNWPSELDIAKSSGNWAAQAQQYFCAATVLSEESLSAQQRFHENLRKEIDINALIRQQTANPTEFCLAFAIELSIKAVLVTQGKLDELVSGEALPFDHKLLNLAHQIDGLDISEEEQDTLLWASEAVLNGKYPVSKKPGDIKSGVPISRSLAERVDRVEPLYRKLMEMTNNGN
jgi:hypothetical protein